MKIVSVLTILLLCGCSQDHGHDYSLKACPGGVSTTTPKDTGPTTCTCPEAGSEVIHCPT